MYATHSAPALRVLVADDHALVRIALRLTLELGGQYRVVAEARDGGEVLPLLTRHEPHILVLDPGMPGMPCDQLIAEAKFAFPELKIVVLTGNLDPQVTARLLAAGADAYVIKADEPDELMLAFKVVMAGGCHVSPSLAHALDHVQLRPEGSDGAGGADDFAPSPVGLGSLTQRELEVLKFVGGGSSNQEAAAALGISVGTVRKHRENLMRKLKLRNVAQLTAYGIKSGLLN